MNVLIVADDGDRRTKLEVAFSNAGFQVTSTGSQIIAKSCIRNGMIDLLFMAERVEGRLTHALSLLAECCNPMVETIMSSPRCDPDIEELFLLLPSLHCILGEDVTPSMITKVAIAALEGAKKRHGPLVLTSTYRVGSISKMESPYFTARHQTKICASSAISAHPLFVQ